MNWTSLVGIALWALLPGFIARKKGRSFWAYYFLSLVITPLLTTIITLFLSNINSEDTQVAISKKKSASQSITTDTFIEVSDSEQKEPIASQTVAYVSPRKIMYCRRCGTKLVEESKFCSNCGTQIEKKDKQ